MPVEVPTMVPTVPVGAWVSKVTLRRPCSATFWRTDSGMRCMNPLCSSFSALKRGNFPFSTARSLEAS